ncbi:mucin-2-like isoform X2 [Neoarius graeffei]|uniref:mucin-2-like isoform X2 n=1 Tax=Neoarius graeffei TaxID=443677 RepID=UPI00298D369E|nr:mucin-2-like isoform X2 [Neoarius graeffei]
MAALVLLFFFHLILDIRSQNVPQLLVSPEVLTERGSVELHCSVPHNVKVSRCSFYPEGDDTNIKLSPSPSCRLSVTGFDLIRWTGRSSPGTLRIICFYALDNSVRSPSPHSRPAPVTVLNQKPVLSVVYDNQSDEFRFVCEIPGSESVTADLSCNLYTGEKTPLFQNQRSQKSTSGKADCIFPAQRNDVFNRLQSVKSREVSCDYSVTADPTARSPMSEKYNMMHFFPETPQRPTTKPSPTGFSSPSTTSSTTKEKTRAESHGPSTPTTDRKKPTAGFSSPSTTSSTTKEKTRAESHGPSTPTTDRKKPTAGSLSVLLPSVLGVCVLLAGMMSVCLCSFIRKQTAERRKMDLTQGDQDGDEIYTEVMYTLSSQRKRGSFQLPLNDGP